MKFSLQIKVRSALDLDCFSDWSLIIPHCPCVPFDHAALCMGLQVNQHRMSALSCPYCQKAFVPSSPAQVFCTLACRGRASTVLSSLYILLTFPFLGISSPKVGLNLRQESLSASLSAEQRLSRVEESTQTLRASINQAMTIWHEQAIMPVSVDEELKRCCQIQKM